MDCGKIWTLKKKTDVTLLIDHYPSFFAKHEKIIWDPGSSPQEPAALPQNCLSSSLLHHRPPLTPPPHSGWHRTCHPHCTSFKDPPTPPNNLSIVSPPIPEHPGQQPPSRGIHHGNLTETADIAGASKGNQEPNTNFTLKRLQINKYWATI